MNSINEEIRLLILSSIELVKQSFQALVFANDAAHFSVGADIRNFMRLIESKSWDQVDRMELDFQSTMSQLKYAPFPIISCPAGISLGAACEIALQSTHCVMASDTKAGLVEAGVGLFPAGTGTTELTLRAYKRARLCGEVEALPFAQQVFDLLRVPKISASAEEAISMGLFAAEKATIARSRDELLFRAKDLALLLAPQFVAQAPAAPIQALGMRGLAAFEEKIQQLLSSQVMTNFDAVIARKIAIVICGGDVSEGTLVSEERLLELERSLFGELCQTSETYERLKFMLQHGQALRN